MHAVGRDDEALPEDLLLLTRQLGSPTVRIEPLVNPDSPRGRAGAFHVRLADGRQLKAHVMLNRAHAERVEYVLNHLHHGAFPAIIARQGRAMLVDWVDGEPATTVSLTTDTVRACGALHASIHTTPVPEPCRYRPADPVGDIHDKLRTDVDALATGGVLTLSVARDILTLGAEFAPGSCAVGFVHRDLCAANVVVGPSGGIHVIDNETLSVGALDFDVARTWYRWRMTRKEREHYFAAYVEKRAVGDLLAHFPFWALAVLLDSIQIRMNAGAAIRSVPVERLRSFLEYVGRGARGDRLVLDA